MHISFYEGLEAVYIIPRLISKAYEQKQRGVVWLTDPALYQPINDVIWTFSKTTFIPHGGKEDGISPDLQAFWLTATLGNPNSSDTLFVVNGANLPLEQIKSLGFDKVINVITQNSEHIQNEYKVWKNANHQAQWWQHGANGWQNTLPQ